jgi:hypothetical protein
MWIRTLLPSPRFLPQGLAEATYRGAAQKWLAVPDLREGILDIPGRKTPRVHLDYETVEDVGALPQGRPERGPERLVRIPHLGDFHSEGTLRGQQAPGLVAVAVALATLATLIRLAAKHLGHLRLKKLLKKLTGSQPGQLTGQVNPIGPVKELLRHLGKSLARWYPGHESGPPGCPLGY